MNADNMSRDNTSAMNPSDFSCAQPIIDSQILHKTISQQSNVPKTLHKPHFSQNIPLLFAKHMSFGDENPS